MLKGQKHSKKAKEKIRKNSAKFWLGKELTKEHKEKISIGKCNPSEKTRKKLSMANKGKKFSIEHIENMRNGKIKMYKDCPEKKKKISERMKKWHKENEPSQGMLNKHHTQETKDKIGKANAIALKGNIVSEKTRRKLSKALKGEKSYRYKGGITSENQIIRNGIDIRLWRNKVFKRDNYICQKTKIKGGDLCSHHIKNFAEFPELRFEIDNGITLSKNSHKEFHKIYGWKNNTREQLIEFLNQKKYEHVNTL